MTKFDTLYKQIISESEDHLFDYPEPKNPNPSSLESTTRRVPHQAALALKIIKYADKFARNIIKSDESDVSTLANNYEKEFKTFWTFVDKLDAGYATQILSQVKKIWGNNTTDFKVQFVAPAQFVAKKHPEIKEVVTRVLSMPDVSNLEDFS